MEPTHEEPTHEEPTHEEPTHGEPIHKEPTHEEPTWLQTKKVEYPTLVFTVTSHIALPMNTI